MGSDYQINNLQPGVEIRISTIGGDLIVEGRDGNEIHAKGDNPRIKTEKDSNSVSVACDGDCRLRVPGDSRVTVEHVGGDAKITGITDAVSIEMIGASLILRDVGAVSVKQIGGDLEVKRASGAVSVERVGADAKFRQIEGSLSVKSIGADALLTEIEGGCTIERIGAELVLNTDFAPNTRYQFSVGADVIGKVSPTANVRFVFPAQTETHIEVPGAQFENDGDRASITLGEGSAVVEFSQINGELRLVGQGISVGDTIEAAFENAFPEDLDEMINARINDQIAHLQHQINRDAERFRRKAERTAQRIRHKHMPNRNVWEWHWPSSGNDMDSAQDEKRKNTAPSEPVSNEERMAILRMVENKQITVEEAERLLAALEGGTD